MKNLDVLADISLPTLSVHLVALYLNYPTFQVFSLDLVQFEEGESVRSPVFPQQLSRVCI